MPRFNPATGDIALYRRDWFDAQRTAYQDCSNAILIGRIATCQIVLSDGKELARANSSLVTAGASIAAWLRNEDATVYDTLGRVWPGAGLTESGVSTDGAYALKVMRDSYGPWDVIERDGSRWRLTDGDAHSIQLLGNKQAIWMIGVDDYCTPGLPIRIPLEHHYGLRAAYVPEENRYITLYQRASDGALVCDGRIVAPPSDKYYYADLEYRNGFARITWSTSQADWDAPLLELTLVQLSQRPWSESTPPALHLPTPTRPLWTGWFEFSGPWNSPGNCTLDVHDNAKVYAKAGILGRFISGPTVEAIEEASRASQERPIAYWDSRVWPRLPSLPAGAWTCLQAYCHAGESPAQFQAAYEALIQSLGSREIALVCQQYTSNASLTADIRSIAPIFCTLANKYSNVKALLLFSGYGRATGLQDHLDLTQPWQEWVSALQTPTVPVYGPPTPSKPPAPPPPAPKPVTPFPPTKSYRGSMKIYAQAHSKYIGVDPSITGTVYANRASGGAWEQLELTPVGNNLFTATFIAANVVLSILPDGRFETRPAGTNAAWEQLCATTQPDGVNLLYRVQDGMVIGNPLSITEAN